MLLFRDMKIGVMGAKGSFSEQAGKQYISEEGISSAEIDLLVTADRVLEALTQKTIDTGIFPIENSSGGVVLEAVHAMAKYQFVIERMFTLDVHHMLHVKPGKTASQITEITSHDQALRQCKGYLKRVWPDVDVYPFKDTAAAAAALHSGELPETTAVIAPRQCAEIYGLDILEESIQDSKFNQTLFIVATQAV